ncbi:HNH endonuclease signature motif containing protein [Agreia sp. VKM Ac-1783]|uniref:HNH endonuclease signature motif containing protein n=1 Tax=Agreia sp. VKM Ac-1783 TaxID=1938889 RepID=UPI000A2AB2F5|nr:HNH endonuclease signature motif containing protein [Agreia sp. VKM Ac-1783]SMQ73787.1 protein of unknown function [Agreia sp. VKM Ac-1783]
MNLETATIDDIVDRLRELFEADRRVASSDELLKVASDWERVGIVADAARIWIAAEVDDASRRELGGDGLAFRNAFPTSKKLIAATANVSERTAASRVRLGRQIRSHFSNTGLPCPSRFPVVEQALFAGRIDADTASVICRTLSEVAARTTFNTRLDEAEQHLVSAATTSLPLADSAEEAASARLYTVDDIARLAIRIRENLDPDGAEPRDEAKQQLRGFSHPRVGSDGMARGRYALPPLQLGVFLAAVDSVLSPRTVSPETPTDDDAHPDVTVGHDERRSARESDNADEADEADEVNPPDERSYEQKLLDAVMTLIEMAAGSPSASLLNGAAPTVNVHVTAKDLESGRGVGWIDGSSEPIPISTVAMLQCTGDTIVSLFGTNGEILNHGKTQRVATRKQRRALAARDGGCVFPGCHHPPSRCQAHHVIPWVSENFTAGATDVDNMALLCAFHHSTIHSSAWQLTMIRGKPHIISPSCINPHRTPRPADKQRAADPWLAGTMNGAPARHREAP